jgi:predicted Fe-Mo cluster-binding NifX family protein
MRLCIPTMNERGLEAPLSAHFGSAPYYTVVETGTGTVEVVGNPRAEHEHGHCNPVAAIADLAPDAVVCMGLGRRALDRLQSAGIQVFQARATQVAQAVSQFESGELSPFAADGCCGGNGHQHEHGHGDGHGHGHAHRHEHGGHGGWGEGQGPGGGMGGGRRGWGGQDSGRDASREN